MTASPLFQEQCRQYVDSENLSDVSDEPTSSFEDNGAGSKPGNQGNGRSLTFRDAADFLAEEYHVRWWVDNVFKRDVPTTIFGPSKSLKTSIAIDLAISIATGGKFLGEFDITEAGKVGYISGEIIDADLQTLLRSVTDAKGLTLDELRGRLAIETTVPSFGHPVWRDALVDAIDAAELDIVFIDPTYFAMADADPSQLGDVGIRLQAVRDAVTPTGCQLVLIHHSTKAQAKPTKELPEINDMTGAGYAEWTRQWIGVNRRAAYDHDSKPGWHQLNCNIGSFRAGWSGILEIDEGTARKPTWQVDPRSRRDIRREEDQQKARAEERKDEEFEFRILSYLRDIRRGEWVTQREIVAELGSKDRVWRLLRSLEKDHRIEQSAEPIVVNNTKCQPWKAR